MKQLALILLACLAATVAWAGGPVTIECTEIVLTDTPVLRDQVIRDSNYKLFWDGKARKLYDAMNRPAIDLGSAALLVNPNTTRQRMNLGSGFLFAEKSGMAVMTVDLDAGTLCNWNGISSDPTVRWTKRQLPGGWTLNAVHYTPTSSAQSDTFLPGDVTKDNLFFYVKTATGWKRAALSTW